MQKKFNQVIDNWYSEAWNTDVARAMDEHCSLNTLKAKINIVVNEKGFPHHLRPRLWKKLIGNEVRMNKILFCQLMDEALKSFKDDCLISKDIERTFTNFRKNKPFTKILSEASLILEMFTIYRPDIKYIQGMSYLVTMLLLHFKPYPAFKAFCNLVLTRDFLYRTYTFKSTYIENLNKALEYIVSSSYPTFYRYLKIHKLYIWKIFWIEWIYAMFLKTFDIKTCLVLWDFILLKENQFVFKLNYIVFGILDENFEEINKDNFLDSCKKILITRQEELLNQIFHNTTFDSKMPKILNILNGLE